MFLYWVAIRPLTLKISWLDMRRLIVEAGILSKVNSMTLGIRILGVVLVALGITFLFLGIDESGTFANRFLKEMAGKYPDETKWHIFGGIVMIVVGLGILSKSFFRKT